MIQNTQREIDYAMLRYDDQLAEAARARFGAEAKKQLPSTKPRKAFHMSNYLRNAVAALVTLASIG